MTDESTIEWKPPGPGMWQMQAWLEDWDVDSSDMGGEDTNGGMSDDDITALEAADGAEFDRMFLAP